MIGIVVMMGRNKATKKFRDESLGEEFYKMACNRFGTDQIFRLSLSKPISPPKGFKPQGKLWWCPICGAPRIFRKNKDRNLKLCTVCGISERYFYVKSMNEAATLSSYKEARAKDADRTRGDGQLGEDNPAKKARRKARIRARKGTISNPARNNGAVDPGANPKGQKRKSSK